MLYMKTGGSNINSLDFLLHFRHTFSRSLGNLVKETLQFTVESIDLGLVGERLWWWCERCVCKSRESRVEKRFISNGMHVLAGEVISAWTDPSYQTNVGFYTATKYNNAHALTCVVSFCNLVSSNLCFNLAPISKNGGSSTSAPVLVMMISWKSKS